MRVFLTGGTGFIGSHLVMKLLSVGDELTLLVRDPDKIPALVGRPGVTMIVGGLEDHVLIRQTLPGHDACIHNALIWDDELELRDTRASVRLFEAAADSGVEHTIYTSSTAVHRPFRAHMDEEDRIAPNDLYGATKAASEAFLSAFTYQTAMRGNVIRPGPTVGDAALPGAPVKSDRRLREIVATALRGEDIPVVQNEGRQFIAARDLADVYASVLRSGANRQTYLAVASDYVSWEKIAREAVAITGSSSRILVEDRELSPCQFDAGKIGREFGLEFRCRPAILDELRRLAVGERLK